MAEDRSQEAIDHLQLAALELIAALRAVLDVAEEAVREPHALRDVIAATARAAAQAAGAAAQAGGAAGRDAGNGGVQPDAGVEHISIS